MANYINEQRLLKEIEAAIRAEIDRAVEIAVEEIVTQVRKTVRERLAAVALGLLSEYNLERLEKHLVIRVKVGE